jgi:hypothetical protein
VQSVKSSQWQSSKSGRLLPSCLHLYLERNLCLLCTPAQLYRSTTQPSENDICRFQGLQTWRLETTLSCLRNMNSFIDHERITLSRKASQITPDTLRRLEGDWRDRRRIRLEDSMRRRARCTTSPTIESTSNESNPSSGVLDEAEPPAEQPERVADFSSETLSARRIRFTAAGKTSLKKHCPSPLPPQSPKKSSLRTLSQSASRVALPPPIEPDLSHQRHLAKSEVKQNKVTHPVQPFDLSQLPIGTYNVSTGYTLSIYHTPHTSLPRVCSSSRAYGVSLVSRSIRIHSTSEGSSCKVVTKNSTSGTWEKKLLDLESQNGWSERDKKAWHMLENAIEKIKSRTDKVSISLHQVRKPSLIYLTSFQAVHNLPNGKLHITFSEPPDIIFYSTDESCMTTGEKWSLPADADLSIATCQAIQTPAIRTRVSLTPRKKECTIWCFKRTKAGRNLSADTGENRASEQYLSKRTISLSTSHELASLVDRLREHYAAGGLVDWNKVEIDALDRFLKTSSLWTATNKGAI